MDEYGLSPDELIAKDFRVIQSSRRDYFPHGRKDWITAIKAAYKRDRNLTTKGLQLTCPALYHQGVWIFGSWDTALRAAGFKPERVRRQKRRDTETLLQEIRGLRARNLPLYANYATRNHAAMFKKGLRQYGSWNATLVAAAVLTKPIRATRIAVVRAMRDALERDGRASIPPTLKLQAEYYFGSLQKALVALKKDRSWSKRKILKAISRLPRKALAFTKARGHAPQLVSASQKYFGSWGRAVAAAGIDPNLYFVHHTWRKARVRI
jgi:hypothetical protein